jgi:hypothetical protein
MPTNKLYNIYASLSILSFKIEANLFINNIKIFTIKNIVRIKDYCVFLFIKELTLFNA